MKTPHLHSAHSAHSALSLTLAQAPTYPSGYCVDSDFKIRLKEFWVTAYFTCQSGGTTITPTWKASLFIADPQRDYAEIPIGYKIQSGPSTNPTQNWFTDLVRLGDMKLAVKYLFSIL